MSRQKKEEKITKPNSIISYFYKAMGNQTCFVSAYNINSQGVATDLLYPINTQNMTNGSKTITFTYTGTGRQYLSFAFYIFNHTNPLATRFFTIDNLTIKFTGNYPFTETVAVYDGKDYRYGFNGKENDNEIIGKGRWQDYGLRMYRPDLGRFFSVDPLTMDFPWNSTFAFAENNPIQYIDLDGGEKKEPPKPESETIIRVTTEHKVTIGVQLGLSSSLWGFNLAPMKVTLYGMKTIIDKNLTTGKISTKTIEDKPYDGKGLEIESSAKVDLFVTEIKAKQNFKIDKDSRYIPLTKKQEVSQSSPSLKIGDNKTALKTKTQYDSSTGKTITSQYSETSSGIGAIIGYEYSVKTEIIQVEKNN